MDISALKNAVNNEVLRSKLWADAKLLVDQVAGLDQYKTELEAGIEKLKAEHERLDASADAVRQSNIDASASARKIVDEAIRTRDKHMEEAKFQASVIVDKARTEAANVQKDIQFHKDNEATARKAAVAAQAEAAKEQAKLDELKAHKARIVKSLTD